MERVAALNWTSVTAVSLLRGGGGSGRRKDDEEKEHGEDGLVSASEHLETKVVSRWVSVERMLVSVERMLLLTAGAVQTEESQLGAALLLYL